jgi:GntR family transcriptional regulator/MocR family aminotransferase
VLRTRWPKEASRTGPDGVRSGPRRRTPADVTSPGATVPAELAPAFAAAKFLADRHAPTLEQAVLAEFIAEGHFAHILRRLRKRVAARRAALLAAIGTYLGDRVEVCGTNAGIHVLLWLRDVPPEKLPAVVRRVEAVGVGVYPSTPCYVRAPRRAELILAYVRHDRGR